MKKLLVTLLAAMSLMVAALASTATAAKPVDPGPPDDQAEATNNLSVPTVFVQGTGTFGVACDAPLAPPPVSPTPVDLPEFELDGYYYVQKVHTWQAQCLTGTTHWPATVAWGDNLKSAEGLKSGTPIRIEVGLLDMATTGLQGYNVVKLQPSVEDRLSAYGHEALVTEDPPGTFTFDDQPVTFPNTYETVDEEGVPVTVTDYVRVFDSQATFSLYNTSTNTWVVPTGTPMGSEINAKGAVVYGYNWGVYGKGVKDLPKAGLYELTFTAPNTVLSGDPLGEHSHTATLTFVVAQKTGGGRK